MKFIRPQELKDHPEDYSFLNSFYSRRNSEAFVFLLDDHGELLYTRGRFVPFMFRRDPQGKEPLRDPYTLDPLSKVEFRDYWDYLEQSKVLEEKSIYQEDGHQGWPEMQWVQQFWEGVRPWDRKIIPADVMFFDIEVYSKGGVPNPMEAKWPIVMVSFYRKRISDKVIVLGLKEFDGDPEDWFEYIHLPDEKTLLRTFFKFMSGVHILSGWNSERFDIPYICKRAENLGILKDLFRISPFPSYCSIREGVSKDLFVGGDKRKILRFDMPGVAHLDYLKMVKRLTYGKNYPSFKLGDIGEIELGEGKVEVSSKDEGIGSLEDLYDKNFNRYVEYSAKDTWILVKLEDKFRLFGLIRALGAMSLAPPEACLETPSKVIEGVLYYYYRKNGYCLPKRDRSQKISYPGAYVKTPIRKTAQDIIYFDLASSYPSHQIVLGISPEVWVGTIKVPDYNPEDLSPGVDPYKIFSSYEEVEVHTGGDVKRVPWDKLQSLRDKKEISISPDGSIWSRRRQGVLPQMLRDGFHERKKVKKMMLEKEKEGDMMARESLYILQWGIKTLLNSTYGVCGSSGTRLSHVYTATAVTTSGKFTILEGERLLNEFFNDPSLWKDLVEKYGGSVPEEWKEEDWVVTMDTDSLIASVDTLINRCFNWGGWDERREKFLDELGRRAIAFVTDIFDNTLKDKVYSSDSDHPIKLDFEVIAQKGIFYARKKYMLRVRVQDGIRKDKIKNTGVDFIKSNTPRVVKEKLQEIAVFILSDEYSVERARELINRFYEELKGVPIEELSIPVSTSAYRKVIPEVRKLSPIEREKKRLGLPVHAKAILNYNWLAQYVMRNRGITIPLIDEDEVKVYFFYTRRNRFGIDVLAFGESFFEFPRVLFDFVKPDYDKQLEKVFLKKVEILMEPLGGLPIVGEYVDIFS